MKKIFFLIFITGSLALGAKAQRDSVSQSTEKTLAAPITKNKTEKEAQIKANPRKIYKSKKNGQKATTTGHEATGSNGGSAPYPKNAGKQDD